MFFIEPQRALVDDIVETLDLQQHWHDYGLDATNADWAQTFDAEDFIDITINDIGTWLSDIQS